MRHAWIDILIDINTLNKVKTRDPSKLKQANQNKEIIRRDIH